jgi:flagellar biogenesis protein FliO
MNRCQLQPLGLLALLFAGSRLDLIAQPHAPVLAGDSLPSVGFSVVRLIGALALVIALFLGGVWLYRNRQRLAFRRGSTPRLSVLEVKSLGQRQALFLIGYQDQRLLLASSPTGMSLICHLPAEDEPTAQPDFGPDLDQALRKVEAMEEALNDRP